MADTSSQVNGPVTYILGVLAAGISQMNANDWLVALSILLVVIRIYIELSDYLHRRAQRKGKGKRM